MIYEEKNHHFSPCFPYFYLTHFSERCYKKCYFKQNLYICLHQLLFLPSGLKYWKFALLRLCCYFTFVTTNLRICTDSRL